MDYIPLDSILFLVLEKESFFIPHDFSSLQAQGALYRLEGFIKSFFT